MSNFLKNKILLVGVLFLGMVIGSLSTPQVYAFVFGSEGVVTRWIKTDNIVSLRDETNNVRVGSSATLFVDTGNNQVGIGTSDLDAYKLKVFGGDVYVGGNFTATGTLGAGAITGLSTTSQLFLKYDESTNYAEFAVDNVNTLTISHIGQTIIDSDLKITTGFLEIVGNPPAGYQLELGYSDDRVLQVTVAADGNVYLNLPSGTKIDLGHINLTTTGTGLFGTVGVNDTSPDSVLEVVSSGDDYFMLSSSADLDGDILIVDSAGNVGIGTITPTQRLDLGSGNFITTGTLGAGAITGASFTIGADTLTTSEWAYLVGQDQSVLTTSSPNFAGLTVGSLLFSGGSITDSSGAISFGDESLTTTDTISAGTMITGDHGTSTTPQVVNVIYGTGDPPAASTTTEGTLFIKYAP